MADNSSTRGATVCDPAPVARLFRHSLIGMLLAISAFAAPAMKCAVAAPAAGDIFVYRGVNGYNNEAYKQASYRIQSSDADRIIVTLTTEHGRAQSTATEIYSPDGKWLRRSLPNHNVSADYEFSPALPAYNFPLEPGKQWSIRVNALIPATGARRSVRVDAMVHGAERIRVPAGEFDTIRISRVIYAGDRDFPLTETAVSEMEWYAPSLGRSVRMTRKHEWRDNSVKGRKEFYGDWDIYELISAPVAR